MDCKNLCPHCGSEMLPIEMPDGTGWDGEIHFVCFNDECEYYKNSWDVLYEQGGFQTGYRCRLTPRETYEAQLVWGPDALKDKVCTPMADPIADFVADIDDWPINTATSETGIRLEEIHMRQGQTDGGVSFCFEDGSEVFMTHDCRVQFFDKGEDRPSVDIPIGELVEWLRGKK